MTDIIDYWADLFESDEQSHLINEAVIPNDKETILASFPEDKSTEKYVPTVDFLESAYDLMNEKFFENNLSRHLRFVISNSPKSKFFGLATCRIDRPGNRVEAVKITLNGARKLTLHNWLEVVLHEMIHILDYETHPEHYLGYMRRYYDVHGSWFLEKGREFEKYGFHVQKYCEAETELDADNKRVQNEIKNSVFVKIKGLSQKDAIVKIPEKDLQKYLMFFANKRKRFYKNINQEVVVLKTQNPNSAKLKKLRMRNQYSGFSYYFYDENFERKYGPFTEEGKYDLMEYETEHNNVVVEDRDEVNYGVMNHIDDEYARKMYDNIGGVVDVDKVGDGKYETTVF